MATTHIKPHPDAVLCRLNSGDVKKYPEGRARDVAEDIADAKREGFVVAVPCVKTANGSPRYISIEPQVGGVEGLEKVLRKHRDHGGGSVPVTMLASDYAKLPKAEKAAMLVSDKRSPDPRDAEIAELKAALAAAQAAQSPQGKAAQGARQ
jgi:hypothetical protein